MLQHMILRYREQMGEMRQEKALLADQYIYIGLHSIDQLKKKHETILRRDQNFKVLYIYITMVIVVV